MKYSRKRLKKLKGEENVILVHTSRMSKARRTATFASNFLFCIAWYYIGENKIRTFGGDRRWTTNSSLVESKQSNRRIKKVVCVILLRSINWTVNEYMQLSSCVLVAVIKDHRTFSRREQQQLPTQLPHNTKIHCHHGI